MAEMISVREAAVRWNITERRVATLCRMEESPVPKDEQLLDDPGWHREAGRSAAQDGRFPQKGACAEAAPAHRRV